MKVRIPYLLLSLMVLSFAFQCEAKDKNRVVSGAEHTEQYFPLLKGKKIAVVANQTATLGEHHLVDSLKKSGITIKCVFAPEHGFRGEAGAGDKIASGIDKQTGIPIISLYGKHLKPSAKDLEGVKVVVFDIQDVGVRFYTYISTLQYVMEACAVLKIKLFVLDRPNPNGYYVDGPVMKKEFSSFVGLQPIPIVYGMTIGEYAKMLNGEGWLENKKRCDLTVIKLENYTHESRPVLRVSPSPNLPDMDAIYMYPSFCLFEGTHVSLGRGTSKPFRLIGFPGYKKSGAERDTSFTPKNIPGVAMNPPYDDTLCRGLSFIGKGYEVRNKGEVNVEVLCFMYERFGEKDKFFNSFFNKLAGNDELQKQIKAHKTQAEIKKTWQKDLALFKTIRKKYLLYDDFK